MKDVLITSSVLILALLVLRRVFRNTISRRVQYALWGLVLVRLLVPVSLPGLEHNVLSVAEPVGQTASRQLEQQKVYVLPTGQVELPEAGQRNPELQPGYEMAPTSTGVMVVDGDGKTATVYAGWLTGTELLRCVWLAGTAGMTLWFLAVNLRFWRKLHKARVPYSVENCKHSVYLVEHGLPSPCLFGLFRPAIYLTPAAVETPERLHHVIAHETTHARHLDPLWSLLRCVCLAVYWFDPLVWAAAIASRADCELACDEGALRCLGSGERIAYGQTLLSLIPVRKTPASPLLAATTMTAGKRQLKDRITRIAENRQTAAAALFLVLALAAAVCAATFTGAAEKTEQDRVLTSEEVAYFNQEFFNGSYPNIRNQFLSSQYGAPEDIDLFELFYCGTGLPETVNESELRQAAATTHRSFTEMELDLTASSRENINAVLLENTGLTLEQTHQTGLEKFLYLPEYDTYYHFHGDTNYRGTVTIACGEWKDGLLCLYYEDTFFGDGWKCVTLQKTGEGYYFVSNLSCDQPAVPTVYPEGDPVLTIPLDNLEPYVPEQTDTEGRVPFRTISQDILVYVPENAADHAQYDTFDGLFGCSGVVVIYDDRINEHYYGTVHDYYAISEDGAPSLLARAYGESCFVDLDGNGAYELAASCGGIAQLFFQRDGAVYCADIGALLQEAWPEARYLSFGWWDAAGRSLSLSGEVPISGTEITGTAFRGLYFDGKDLLLYKDDTTYTDHVADGIDAPADVIAAAKERVLEQLDWWQHHTGAQGYIDGQWQDVGELADWDDWRITRLELTDTAPAYPELGLRVYGLSYELHSSTPEKVQSAGGMYIREDGWVGGMYDETPYLLFHTLQSSGPVFLENHIPSDVGSSDNPVFAAYVAQAALENGLLTPSEVRGTDLYYLFYANQTDFLNLLGKYSSVEQAAALDTLTVYAASGTAGEDSDLFAAGLQNLERNSSDLTEGGQAAYERLLAADRLQSGEAAEETAVPALTGEDYGAMQAALDQRMEEYRSLPGVVSLKVLETGFSGEESAKAVSRYTGSALARSRGWSDSLVAWMQAVQVVWTAELDGNAMDGALNWNDGANACWFYLLPNTRTGGWDIVDTISCAPPERYQADPTALPFAEQAQPQVSLTQYGSYEEAYASITARKEQAGNTFSILEELPGDGFTVVSWAYGGTPHGTAAVLNVVYEDGTLASLPLPPRSEWGVADPAEELVLSSDGSALTYTARFDDDLVNAGGTAVWHRAGIYHYTYDIASRTVSLEITEN